MDDISCPIDEWVKSKAILIVQGGHSTQPAQPITAPFWYLLQKIH